MEIKSLSVQINKSKRISGYATVDIIVRYNGNEKELNELLPENDFESKFDQMLELLKKEVLSNIKDNDL
jgi:hypothetical protein